MHRKPCLVQFPYFQHCDQLPITLIESSRIHHRLALSSLQVVFSNLGNWHRQRISKGHSKSTNYYVVRVYLKLYYRLL